ncbi:MAG TPA: LLM class flavin-dependent oxidoreductase [Streptosporangiaceae bacterium]|nr:LLM class flavin-dependent oxidoreductase [Streptosporangiaceae bacterium]
MILGVTIPQRATLAETLDEFAAAEETGAGSLWFSQPPGGLDALTVLALAAGRTRAARLGTAVLPTFPSHPLLTARAVQTAAAAAPGRIVLGVGAGHRAWVEHEYGQRFDRPVHHVTEWVATVRRLLAGEALAASDNAFGLTVAGSGATTEVPIVVAGTGPRMLSAAGRIADGVLTWMCDEAYLAEVVFPAVARGAADAGRPAPPVIAGVLICVSDHPDEARAALAPRLAPLGRYDSYRAVLSHGAPAPRPPVDVSVIGAEADVAAALGRLAAAGVSEVVAVVLPDPADPAGSAARARRLLAAMAAQQPPQAAVRPGRES